MEYAAHMIKKDDVRFFEGKTILALEQYGKPVIAEGAGEYSQVIPPVFTIQLEFHFGPIELTQVAGTITLPDKRFLAPGLLFLYIIANNGIAYAMAI
jgi:hypothetical protein